MARPFTSDAMGLSALVSMTGEAGLLDAMTLRLFMNDFTPGPDSVAADYEAADFDGYAPVAAVELLAVGQNEEGLPTAYWEPKAFTKSGAVTDNVIFGWMLTSAAGTTIWIARRLDEPVAMSLAGQVLVVSPELSWREGGRKGRRGNPEPPSPGGAERDTDGGSNLRVAEPARPDEQRRPRRQFMSRVH